MLPAPIASDDTERVASLERMNLVSTTREADFDRITRLAQKLFETDIALISLVDKDRQWFKSKVGLNATETPRDISFCGHAIQSDEVFVVEDAHEDERFRDNPLVTAGPKVRFYAGQPIKNREGYRIGTLCVISPERRNFGQAQRTTLGDIARMAEVVLENRKLSDTQLALLESVAQAERDTLLDPLTGLWNRRGLDGMLEREISKAVREQIPLAVCMVDIDHFKNINDSFGHGVGDDAIKLAADLLTQVARSTDIVARIGGEEFVIIAPNVAPAMIPTIGSKVVSVFRTSAKIKTNAGFHSFTTSVGLVSAKPTKYSAEIAKGLLESADKALYQAKASGRDRFEIVGIDKNLYSDFALA